MTATFANDTVHRIMGCACKGALIHSIICDTLAKSFITLTKGHTGYFSYSKCTIEGDFIANRICFPNFDYQIRTDDSFRNSRRTPYWSFYSIKHSKFYLVVSHIPLDYIHMICIGVMKKLIKLWISAS